MGKIKSKLKESKPFIISDYKWKDIILIGQIPNDFDMNKLHITKNTFGCVSFDEQLYGIDLFEDITDMDTEDLQQWSYKLKLNGIQQILLNVNSIRDKYKIAYYNNGKKI